MPVTTPFNINDHLATYVAPHRALAAELSDQLTTNTDLADTGVTFRTVVSDITAGRVTSHVRWNAGPCVTRVQAAANACDTYHQLVRMSHRFDFRRKLTNLDRARALTEAVDERPGTIAGIWQTSDLTRWLACRDLSVPTPVTKLAATLLLERHTELVTSQSTNVWADHGLGDYATLETQIRELIEVATATIA